MMFSPEVNNTNPDDHLEAMVPQADSARADARKFIAQFRMQILGSSARCQLETYMARARAISLKPETDHSGLLNYLALSLMRDGADDSTRLPPVLRLDKFRPILQNLLKLQNATNHEHGRSGIISWSPLRLRFTLPIEGDSTSIRQVVEETLPCGEFFSFHIHTHPSLSNARKVDSLHFSYGDFFTFECSILGAAVVACAAGALLAVKKHGAVSPRSAGETVALLKNVEREIEMRVDLTGGQKARRLTGTVCKAFHYDLYRIADLDEMVARRVEI